MRNKLFILAVVLVWGLGLSTALSAAGDVTHAPASVKNLETGWEWAFNTAAQKAGNNGFYIGYMIEHEKENGVCTGGHKGISLYEIIYGKKATVKRSEKEVAILFRFENRPKNRLDFREVDLNSMHYSAKLKSIPLFWLGRIQNNESIRFLGKCFKTAGTNKNRENLVAAVGIHGPNAQGFRFLKKVLTGDSADDVREQAAFWISQQHSPEAAKILIHTVYNDKSENVRENAVFGLSMVNIKEADDELVKLAKKGKDKEVRKKAIFWLGQKASAKMGEILGDVVENDTDTDIQKAAVFALSQHPGGVSKLIKIADSHRSLKVRKQAIFWLGQSQDPRALNKILSILEK
jgi:hypothetical protein